MDSYGSMVGNCVEDSTNYSTSAGRYSSHDICGIVFPVASEVVVV